MPGTTATQLGTAHTPWGLGYLVHFVISTQCQYLLLQLKFAGLAQNHQIPQNQN